MKTMLDMMRMLKPDNDEHETKHENRAKLKNDETDKLENMMNTYETDENEDIMNIKNKK